MLVSNTQPPKFGSVIPEAGPAWAENEKGPRLREGPLTLRSELRQPAGGGGGGGVIPGGGGGGGADEPPAPLN